MARINIDDQFWSDILSIVAAVGDHHRAVGQVVCFFKLAQEKHKSGKLISEADFARGGFHEALIGVFADRVDGGIKAVGAEKHFGWLAKRVEAGAKGGRSKTEAKLSNLKQNQAKPSNAEASYSSSYSSSSSSSPSSVGTRAPGAYGFSSAEELYAAIPLLTREKWERQTGGSDELKNVVVEAYEFHTFEPARMPRTPGAWMKKLYTWIEIDKGKSKPRSDLKNLDLDEEPA